VKLRRVADRRDAMTCMARHEGGPTGVSGGKIEELTARLADATKAASAEIFGDLANYALGMREEPQPLN
jgi:hypothetical protein